MLRTTLEYPAAYRGVEIRRPQGYNRNTGRVELANAKLDSWRQLERWEGAQLKQGGRRHPRRFYPKLTPREQRLNAASQGPLRDKAADRPPGNRERSFLWKAWTLSGAVADNPPLSGSNVSLNVSGSCDFVARGMNDAV